MKKTTAILLLTTTLLLITTLALKAQYIGSRNNAAQGTTERFIFFSPSNAIGNSRMVESMKDSTSYSSFWLNHRMAFYGSLRNDGTPTSIGWYDDDGWLKRSPVSALQISYSQITGTKKQETYSGTTNGSGVYTVTFPVAYSIAPNIQANVVNQSNTNQFIRISSITTNGFTVNVSGTDVTDVEVDVLITEK